MGKNARFLGLLEGNGRCKDSKTSSGHLVVGQVFGYRRRAPLVSGICGTPAGGGKTWPRWPLNIRHFGGASGSLITRPRLPSPVDTPDVLWDPGVPLRFAGSHR